MASYKRYPKKSSNDYSEHEEHVSESPHAAYSPASKSTDDTYTPTDFAMKHDSVFAELAPGVANSGNLKHKWGAEGEHWQPEEPPSGLAGD